MGTSKAYGGITGEPNWSQLSDSITRACDTGDIPEYKLSRVTSNFVKLIGGSNKGGRGGSKISGRAGISTAQKLGGFLSDVKSSGLKVALSAIGFETSDSTRVDDTINFLLEFCAGVASSLDESAAKAAERTLLDEIKSEAENFEELATNFEETLEDYGVEELLIRYYAYYVYEHLSIGFYEKLIKGKGSDKTSNLYKQLKYFLLEKVKNISLNRNLSKIIWNSRDGEDLVKNIFEDTLKAFEGYEG